MSSDGQELSPSILSDQSEGSPYLEKLKEEKKNLALFAQDLTICNKLLNREILRVYDMIGDGFEQLQLGSPTSTDSSNSVQSSEVSVTSVPRWEGGFGRSLYPYQGIGALQGFPIGPRNSAPAGQAPLLTKRWLRLDVPVDTFPNYNFVGRVLGPRGNSLKRIEALTGCHIFLRGKGSVRDPEKEARLRRRPECSHLDEPLHILIEAAFPANIVDEQLRLAGEIIKNVLTPVEPSRDAYKKLQLEELAMINKASWASGSGSRCWSTAIARPTTSWKGKGVCTSSSIA